MEELFSLIKKIKGVKQKRFSLQYLKSVRCVVSTLKFTRRRLESREQRETEQNQNQKQKLATFFPTSPITAKSKHRNLKMSWQTYVDDHLMCEIEGNHLSAAAIIGQDGSVWAQSATFPQVPTFCSNLSSFGLFQSLIHSIN